MKTITKLFKTIAVLIILTFNINITAQKETKTSKTFIRVYNLEGEKINKGKIIFVNDSILGLIRKKKLVQVPVEDIGYIKTKRSAGHNVLVGSVVGGAFMAMAGGSSSTSKRGLSSIFLPSSFSEGAQVGLVLGGVAGATVGGVTILFKDTNTYIINGDIKKLNSFVESVKN